MKKLINHFTEKPDPKIQILPGLFTNSRLRPNKSPGIRGGWGYTDMWGYSDRFYLVTCE